jgi:hypothetical protein
MARFALWHSVVRGIPVADDVFSEIAVLSLSEAGRQLDVPANKVRQMVRDKQLVAIRRGRELVVPTIFLEDGEVLKGLPGTITVLADSGFSSTEMMRWLFAEDESLVGTTPINALKTGHVTEVRRRAQAMAF